MMSWLFWAAFGLVGCFGLVVLVGAPYLPTLSDQTEKALDVLNLKPGQHLLDLGSGDGTVLLHAAKRGIRATGYELNPLLFLFSWLRTRRYRTLITVKWGNFWRRDWPDSDGIFVFLHTRFMVRLDKRLKLYTKDRVTQVVSFTFPIPNKKPKATHGGLFLYEYTT